MDGFRMLFVLVPSNYNKPNKILLAQPGIKDDIEASFSIWYEELCRVQGESRKAGQVVSRR